MKLHTQDKSLIEWDHYNTEDSLALITKQNRLLNLKYYLKKRIRCTKMKLHTQDKSLTFLNNHKRYLDLHFECNNCFN